MSFDDVFFIDETTVLRARTYVSGVAVSEDITLRKEYEDKLVHQANFDDLTQLPNRVLLMDRLARAIKSAKRTGRHVALMLVDLDRFKNINDTLGHAAGDQLLCEAASRLEDCMREGDTVARLGGDEFAAVLSDLAAPHDVEAVATRMLDGSRCTFFLIEAPSYRGGVKTRKKKYR